MNPEKLESVFEKFTSDLNTWLPDGIIEINIQFLEETGLLNYKSLEPNSDKELPFYFHVLETSEKVTLFNHQFVIWIVPNIKNGITETIVLISLIREEDISIEIAFSTTGVYNTSKFILKILKYYLAEVVDTETTLSSIGNSCT